MDRENIKINDYVDIVRLIYAECSKYDILIDFYDKKKWLGSKKITATLIPHEEGALFRDYSSKRNELVRKRSDNSILYVCNTRGRYEYFFKDDNGLLDTFLSNNISIYINSRDTDISFWNQFHDTLVDNGIAKKDYKSPCIYTYTPLNNAELFSSRELTKRETLSPNPFIIETRNDGGHYLLDKKTRMLKYVCNIGKRYEYYFKGEYQKKFNSYVWNDNDVLIELKPDKEDVYIPIITLIDPKNNPYVIHKRDDGGIYLHSKKDNLLKYICNIGKNFYYKYKQE